MTQNFQSFETLETLETFDSEGIMAETKYTL